MVIRATFTFISAIGATLVMSGGAVAQTEELTRTIPIGAGGSFTLSNLSGDITVTGTETDALTLRAVKRVGADVPAERIARALERVDIEIRERGNRVSVETDHDDARDGGGSVAVDFEVTLPRDTQVDVETVSGSVTMVGVAGETRVEVVSGAIRLTSLSRLDEAETVSGDLEVTEVAHTDDLSLSTVSGRIEVDGVSAPRLDVSSVSGAITLRDVESRVVTVEVVSGEVLFEGALADDGAYDFESHSGDVRLVLPEGSGFEVEAESFSGELRSDPTLIMGQGAGAREVTGFDASVRSFEAIAGDGGAQVEVSTFSGDIVIDHP